MFNYDDSILRSAEEYIDEMDKAQEEQERGKKALAALEMQEEILNLFEERYGNPAFSIERIDGKYKMSFDCSEFIATGKTLSEMFDNLRDYLIEQEEEEQEKDDISFEELLEAHKNDRYRM